MAPNGGHLLVGKAARLFRLALDRASRVLRDKLPSTAQPLEANVEPVYARISTRSQHPINRLIAIRQGQARGFSTKATIRHFSNSTQHAAKPSRSSYPSSRTAQRVSQLTGRTPFASTLRPNLTGGALPRTSGGYGMGSGRIGGRRYFSHTPAAPAEVVQNVSQAVRAFWLSGQKAHFDGYDAETGHKKFRSVSDLQDKTRRALEGSPARAAGSFIDFKVSPTITAIGPLAAVPRRESFATSCESVSAVKFDGDNLANTDLFTTLQIDFSRALKDLAAIMNDLKHLSILGALPLSLINQSTLRVSFPGCDRDTVENLCTELNIRRGIVGQDEHFEKQCGTEMALLFPFAPSKPASEFEMNVIFDSENYRADVIKKTKRKHDPIIWDDMLSPVRSASPGFSSGSRLSDELLQDVEVVENPWLSSPSGYSTLSAGEFCEEPIADTFRPASYSHESGFRNNHADYEGLEGIYRFIGECDRARR